MSKKRLEEFKNMLNDSFDTAYYAGITLTYEQLYYLTEKLGKEIECRTAYEKLYKQNKRYREALEFYANSFNYEPFGQIYSSNYLNEIDVDNGQKARKALKGDLKWVNTFDFRIRR